MPDEVLDRFERLQAFHRRGHDQLHQAVLLGVVEALTRPSSWRSQPIASTRFRFAAAAAEGAEADLAQQIADELRIAPADQHRDRRRRGLRIVEKSQQQAVNAGVRQMQQIVDQRQVCRDDADRAGFV